MPARYFFVPINGQGFPVIRITERVMEQHGVVVIEDKKYMGPRHGGWLEFQSHVYVLRSQQELLRGLSAEDSGFTCIRHDEGDLWDVFRITMGAEQAAELLAALWRK